MAGWTEEKEFRTEEDEKGKKKEKTGCAKIAFEQENKRDAVIS